MFVGCFESLGAVGELKLLGGPPGSPSIGHFVLSIASHDGLRAQHYVAARIQIAVLADIQASIHDDDARRARTCTNRSGRRTLRAP